MTRNWTSSVRGGRNIAIENSFRIQYENNSNQAANVGLFSLGSNNITQQTTTQNNSLFKAIDWSTCVDANGLVTQPIRIQLWANQLVRKDSSYVYGTSLQMTNPILAQSLPIGYNILNLPIGVNWFNFVYTFLPLPTPSFATSVPRTNGQFVDLYGNFCSQWYIAAADQANSLYSLVFPNAVVNRIRVLDAFSVALIDVSNGQVEQSSLDVNNPFVQTFTQTPVSVGAIQQSSNGGTIGVLCLDIYSQNTEQILQSVDYQFKDTNGNLVFFSADPIINPYQPQVGSISCLDLEMMQINNETTVFYNVLPNSSALITYNYVRFTIWDYYEFDRVFAQQLRDNFLLQKRLLDRGRLSLLQVE